MFASPNATRRDHVAEKAWSLGRDQLLVTVGPLTQSTNNFPYADQIEDTWLEDYGVLKPITKYPNKQLWV